jgi:RNA polymerase sigma-70 factor (ECF subfamily)
MRMTEVQRPNRLAEARSQGRQGQEGNMSASAYLSRRSTAHSGVLEGRFRRVNRLVDDEAGTRAVAQAVARAKQGDREALRFLYVHYADHVYGYVSSIVRDDYEAEDVTQHLFAKLMTALPKYEPREVPFSAWILRVARNVAVDHMRQRRPVPCEEVRELDVREEDDESSRHRSLGLRDALASLPEDQRQVVVMRHLVGLTPGEIAGRLGRTEPSIHGLHHRGRGALRTALTKMDCGPTIGQKVAA